MRKESEQYLAGVQVLFDEPFVWSPHSGGKLIEHLLNTADILRKWDLEESVILAGLFHSVYGTDNNVHSIWGGQDRIKVSRVIGHYAESLAWSYSTTSLHKILATLNVEYNSKFVDLLYISVANFIEQQTRLNLETSPHEKKTLLQSLKFIKPHIAKQLNYSIYKNL